MSAQQHTHNTHEGLKMELIRIYVACLAAYNNGYLHGEWIDATQEPEDIQKEVNEMLKKSPIADAEEWAIHDYEGFGSYNLSEYAGFDEVSRLAKIFEKYDSEVFNALLSEYSCIDEAIDAIENRYAGCFKSLSDYAMHMYDHLEYEIPKSLEGYIDYAAMGRDIEVSGDIVTVETGFEELHVFYSA